MSASTAKAGPQPQKQSARSARSEPQLHRIQICLNAQKPHSHNAKLASSLVNLAPSVPSPVRPSDTARMEAHDDDPYWHQSDARLAEYHPPKPEGLTWDDAFYVLIHARDLLTFIFARFWSPAAIGKLTHVTKTRRREFLDWLRPVELMLRRLLFIEASALAATLTPAAQEAKAPASIRPATSAPSAPGPAIDDAPPRSDLPQDWAASFRVSPTASVTSPNGNAPARGGVTHIKTEALHEDLYPARPLALRLEALVRVVVDPMRYVRRLSTQLLHADQRAFAHLAANTPCRIPIIRPTLAMLLSGIAPLVAASRVTAPRAATHDSS